MSETRVDARLAGDRVDELLGRLPPHARQVGEELVRTLVDLYGAGMERMLDIAWRDDGSSEALFQAWGSDPLVRGLMLVHGLHPDDLETRVEDALERVRPHLQTHHGDVRLVGIEDGLVRVRLEGTCNGCPSSAVTMQNAVRKAVEEAAPDAEGVVLVDDAVEPAAVDLVCPPALHEMGMAS